MFEAIEGGQILDKKAFKAEEPDIRADLLTIQNQLSEANVATLIIVAGTEGGGKGEVVDRLNKWLDTQSVETHAFWDETDDESERPPAWRFWKRLPRRGDMAIMFGGWYWNLLYDRAFGEIDATALDEKISQVTAREQMLHQDGLLIIKLWFHLSQGVFEKAMAKRREVNKHIRSDARKGKKPPAYDAFLAGAEDIIKGTNTSACPWHLIASDDKWFRDKSVAKILISRMKDRLSGQADTSSQTESEERNIIFDVESVKVAEKLGPDCSLSKEKYQDQLAHFQDKIHELSWKAYDSQRSAILVFEGSDAAGKGGAIRRLTTAMDARLYRVISVSAPTDEELSQHYLWRFWRHVPRDGFMTLYDRSWYGRVLVERVEELASRPEWSRAYREINDFENLLLEHGTMVIKFWFHIDKEVQFERFRDREETAWKRHKLTSEDWRNRDKWDEYEGAMKEMVARTDTQNAPWVMIPANDKFYARIEVLKAVSQRLELELAK